MKHHRTVEVLVTPEGIAVMLKVMVCTKTTLGELFSTSQLVAVWGRGRRRTISV